MSHSSGKKQFPAGRASQMVQQEDWIAKKKAEIEEKNKKKEDQHEGQSQVQQVKGQSKDNKKRPGFKNRWGFKGKVDQKPATTVAAPVTNAAKIQFSNDGSFLQQFRKMQEQQEAKVKVEEKQKQEVKVDVKAIGQ